MKYRLISKYLAAIWKPKEEKVWSTEVTDEKCNTLVKDEFGAIYSRYWKKLFSAPRSLSGEYSTCVFVYHFISINYVLNGRKVKP